MWGDPDAYELYMGRWSRQLAREFVCWLGAPHGSSWLDVGCGTGALCDAILKLAAPAHVTGVDPSKKFLEYARASIPSVDFMLGSADALPFPDASFDVVVSGLVINLLPDPLRGVQEMARVAKPGGAVGLYVWDYADGMQFLRYFWDAAKAIDPAAEEQDEGARFPVCSPLALRSLMTEASLKDVGVDSLEIETIFSSFDDYWQSLLGGQGPASSYVLSLKEDLREALRSQLLKTLPIAADGSIPLRARAWCARGMAQTS